PPGGSPAPAQNALPVRQQSLWPGYRMRPLPARRSVDAAAAAAPLVFARRALLDTKRGGNCSAPPPSHRAIRPRHTPARIGCAVLILHTALPPPPRPPPGR